MPHNHSTRPRTRLAVVPAAVLIPPPHAHAEARPVGLSAHAATAIVRRYTTRGQLVVDLDGDPHVTTAVAQLRRRLAGPDTSTSGEQAPDAGRAVLVVARLPRPGATGPKTITGWMRDLGRRLLAPGGHLVVVLATGAAGRRLAGHTGVVACARAAGLAYQQQLIDIWQPVDEHEPAAEPATAAAATAVRLVAGRHRPAHREVYVFTTGGRP